MSSPIEDYGLIGDGQTAALVNRDGLIDWLCWPRFDSDACFAALLGDERHGSWSFAPKSNVIGRSRRYEEDTLILQTDAEVEGGSYRVTDPLCRSAVATCRPGARRRGAASWPGSAPTG